MRAHSRLLLRLGALFLMISAGAAWAQESLLSGYYTLANAASLNKTEDVVAMVRRGDNPNIVDSAGRTPLGYAAASGNMDMAQALLGGGARLDFRDTFGNTALHWAAEEGQAAIIRLLVDAKAPVDATNKQGITPLMLAAGGNKLEAVRALLAGGADPKRQDFTGRDSLGWANGKAGTLRLLQQAAAR